MVQKKIDTKCDASIVVRYLKVIKFDYQSINRCLHSLSLLFTDDCIAMVYTIAKTIIQSDTGLVDSTFMYGIYKMCTIKPQK